MADDSTTYEAGVAAQEQREQEMRQQAQVLRAQRVRAQQAKQRASAAAARGQQALTAEAEAVVSKMGAWGLAAVTLFKFFREHKILLFILLLLIGGLVMMQFIFYVGLFYYIEHWWEARGIAWDIIVALFNGVFK